MIEVEPVIDTQSEQVVYPTSKEAQKIQKMITKIKKILAYEKANKILWVPKAIAVASMYSYYDFFDLIL